MFRRRFARFALPLAMTAAVHTAYLACPTAAWAQQKSATDLIARGKSLFDDQQYEESIQTLSAALLRPNNTKQQRIDVYRLLALNYITLNRKDEAESAVRGLLALEPGYQLPKSESPRFRDFFANAQKKWEDDGRPGLVKESEPPPTPVTMQHQSPSQVPPGTEIPLSVKLDDPQGRVFDVKLFFRPGSEGKFAEQETQFGNDIAKATIPGSVVKPPLVEYFFEGFDKNKLPIVARGDAEAPLRVAVPAPGKGWLIGLGVGAGVAVIAGVVIGILFATGTVGGASGQSTVSVSVTE
jgi:hypothetical protein